MAEEITGVRPLSSFTMVEQRAILALIRCADSPYVAPPPMSAAVRRRIDAERSTPRKGDKTDTT